MPGLHCCPGFSLAAASGGYSLVALCGLLIVAASLVEVACGLNSCCSGSSRVKGSAAVPHGLSCSTACGIFPDQGSNLCLLHWQVDSLSLSHEGSFRANFLDQEDLAAELGKLLLSPSP